MNRTILRTFVAARTSGLRFALLSLAMLAAVAVACTGGDATVAPQATPTAGGGTPAALATLPRSGSPAAAVRRIEVDNTAELKFKPDIIEVQTGETVEFVLTNSSGFYHTFTIATSKEKTQVLEDAEISGPGERKGVSVTFPNTPQGLYLFCRPHEIAGMIGKINVK